MKTYLLFALLIIANALHANDAKNALKAGNFAKAFELSYAKVQHKTWRKSFTYLLEESYTKANAKDHLEIQKLFLLNNEADAERIMQLFLSIKNRQDKVKLLGIVTHKKSNIVAVFPIINCEEAIVTYKNKTLDYNYSIASQHMANGSRMEARKAYDVYCKIEKMQSNFKDVANLKAQAKELGTTYVLVLMHNNSNTIMPRHIETQLLNTDGIGLHKDWIIYNTQKQEHVNYHYTVNLNITNIEISGNNTQSNTYDLTTQVKDGVTFEKDKSGNYILDTLGKKIKVDNYKTLAACVTEVQQSKVAYIQASVIIKDNSNNTIIQSAPIAYNYTWANTFATYIGATEALDNRAKNLICNGFLMFPNNEKLLLLTKQGLHQNFRTAITKQTPTII